VALDLARRAWGRGERSVGERDRIPRVLPALVVEAGLRVAPLVFDVAVAVPIAVVIDPVARRARFPLEPANELLVAGPALVFLEEDQKKRRGVGGSVVGRLRPLLEGRHLAEPKLVQDLARLLVAERVVHARLEDRQRLKCRRGELRVEREGLE